MSLVVNLQHKYEGKSRLLGCGVPSATAAAAAAAGTGVMCVNAAAAVTDSSLTGAEVVCLGYTDAPEVLTYDMISLENSTITCLSYIYVFEPLDRLLRHIAQQPEAGHSSSSSSDGCSGSAVASGSNTNSSSPAGIGGAVGASSKTDLNSSSSSSGTLSQQARAGASAAPATAVIEAAAAGKGASSNPSKEASKGARGLKKGFFSFFGGLPTKPVDAPSGLKKGFFASKVEVPEEIDLGKLPMSPGVVQQLVDCLFVPGREGWASSCSLAVATVPTDGGEAVEADGAVAAGPVAPTAQHLGLVLELLLLAWPGGTAGDGQLDNEQRSGQEGERDVEEVRDQNHQQQQQGDQAAGEQGEGKQNSQQQQQQVKKGMLPSDELGWQRSVEWLLLLGVFLQQATSEAKQQLMMQQGSLMMQLLYRMLLEDVSLGGQGQVTVSVYDGSWGVVLSGGREAAAAKVKELNLVSYPMRKLVLLVLQGLVYEPLRWSDATAKAVKEAKMLYCTTGGWQKRIRLGLGS